MVTCVANFAMLITYSLFYYNLYVMTLTADIKKLERKYVPVNFTVKDWASLEPFFIELTERPIHSKEDLEKWTGI